MTKEELELLKDMYNNAVKAAQCNCSYIDPKAEDKAKLLKKLIDMFSSKNVV